MIGTVLFVTGEDVEVLGEVDSTDDAVSLDIP